MIYYPERLIQGTVMHFRVLNCQVPLAGSVGSLTLPHLGIGVGVGTVDASLLPLLATYVDANRPDAHYASVYALVQCAVAGAYCAGRPTGAVRRCLSLLRHKTLII